MLCGDEMWMLVFLLLSVHVQTGTSSLCSPGSRWNTYLKSYGCFECLENCATCELSTRLSCDTCKVGYYGYGCWLTCSEYCEKGQCRKSSGTCTCIEGYYLHFHSSFYTIIDHYTCDRCPYTCRTCTSSSACTKCKVGHFGNKCDQPCRNCRNDTCSIDGLCTFGCIDGFFLDQTTNDCNECGPSCSNCSNKEVCTTCNQEYANVNGSCLSCQNCDNFTACLSQNICYQCLDGFWGFYCGSKCGETCIRCDKSTGECTECKDNTFGPYCEQKCSSHCFQSPDTSSTCWQHNGTCTDGCLQGFTGQNCTKDVRYGEKHQHGFDVLLHVVVPVLCLLVITVLAQ